jgi:hypothetical protein
LEKKKEPKKNNIVNNIRKYLILGVLTLFLIKLNKVLFFLVFFSVFGFMGKWIRGQFGLKMVVLDPNLFFMLLIVNFFGIKMLVIYLFFNVLVADLVSGIFTIGSFLNYVLYHVCPIGGYLLFGSFGLTVFGNIASLGYSVLYAFFRTKVLPDDPFQVMSKSITSFIFTFLYIAFFGPLFYLILK